MKPLALSKPILTVGRGGVCGYCGARLLFKARGPNEKGWLRLDSPVVLVKSEPTRMGVRLRLKCPECHRMTSMMGYVAKSVVGDDRLTLYAVAKMAQNGGLRISYHNLFNRVFVRKNMLPVAPERNEQGRWTVTREEAEVILASI